MKLEEAIKQTKPFANNRLKGIVNLIYTQGWVSGVMKAHFSSFGITTKQYNILRILNGAGKPVSNAFIRTRMLDRLSDVSRIIDRMHARGLVKKEKCTSDKRLLDVALSSEGKKLLLRIDKQKEQVEGILDNLSEKEVNTLNALLDKIRK